MDRARLAQLVILRTVEQEVVGSTPASGALNLFLLFSHKITDYFVNNITIFKLLFDEVYKSFSISSRK